MQAPEQSLMWIESLPFVGLEFGTGQNLKSEPTIGCTYPLISPGCLMIRSPSASPSTTTVSPDKTNDDWSDWSDCGDGGDWSGEEEET